MKELQLDKLISQHRVLMSDIIYESLKSRILNGVIKQGERLTVLEVAKQFKTSQTPVREAFKQLQMDNLLKNVAFKGVFVEKVEDEEIIEIFQLRAMLETISLKRFVTRFNDENIIELQNLINDMKNAIIDNDISLLVEKDISFHGYICINSNYKNLYPMWSLITGKSRLVIAKKIILYNKRDNINKIVDSHRDLLKAIKKKEIKLVIEKYNFHLKIGLNEMIDEEVEKINFDYC